MKKGFTLLLFALLIHPVLKAQLFNFNSWQNYNVVGTILHAPTGWHAIDSQVVFYGALLNPGAPFYSQVEAESPGNGGTGSALKVMTKNQSALTGFIAAGPFPSFCSNSLISVNTTTGSFDFSGGFPYSNDPLQATLWVKNSPQGGDSTEITILAIDDSDGGDSIAGIADTLLGATLNSFTKITLPFVYNTSGFNTTMLRVIISSSGNFNSDTVSGAFTNLHDGTYVVVDDLEIEAPNGTHQYLFSSSMASVSPTLFDQALEVSLKQGTQAGLMLTNALGQVVLKHPLTSGNNLISTHSLPSGMYYYQISNAEGMKQSGKLFRQ